MYISKLKHIIERHDIYGIHRLNGLKVIYVYFLLAIVNSLFSLPHPYFYFFYIPLTAITAEIVTPIIRDKFIYFTYTMIGTILAIAVFNITKPYPPYFYVSVFFISLMIYLYVLNKRKQMLPFVPIILSLASYSMIYTELTLNFRLVIENSLISLLATFVILCGLFLYPLSQYYRCWLRAWHFLCQDIMQILHKISFKQPVEFSIRHPHLRSMLEFSQMLPRNMRCLAILRINLLMQELYFDSLYKVQNNSKMLVDIQTNLNRLIHAIEHEKPCLDLQSADPVMNKLTKAWNSLC